MRPAGQGEPRPKPIKKDSVLVGRRMWILARDRERWRLSNIAFQTEDYWPRGVYEADCARWQSHPDRSPSPHPDCHCGMYGFWNMEELAKQAHKYVVTGVVQAWGRVLPGVEGFKAQYMLPIAVDWPTCIGTGYNAITDSGSGHCEKPVEWMEATRVQYTEDYPMPGDEDWEIGYEWVNCRVEPRFVCAEHSVIERQSENSWHCPAEKVFADLAVYYELEVWPPLDFPVFDE